MNAPSFAPASVRSMMTGRRVGYLVNQYPKASHTFIRREMLALERLGIAVQRYAVRGWDASVPDPADGAERARTRYLLRDGVLGPLAALVRTALRRPARFATAVRLALRLARRADRSFPFHVVYLAEACLLLEWLKRDGIDHLHAHFGTNPAEVAVLVRALGGPTCSFTVHGPEEFDRPVALHLGDKVAHAAFVVAVSAYGRAQLCRWSHADDWPRIHVVHCGLDPDPHPCVPVPRAARLVCVGRLCEQKGQLLLVEAAGQLRDRGHRFELVLAGDGELREAVEAAIARDDLGGHVHITGWIDGARVREELDAARALVLPSFAEGLPVVIMEAMARARPVISTFVAGIPELVIDGGTGWLVPAGDVGALVDAMEACLRAPPEALDRLGQSGRERVRERHDVEHAAAALARLFARSAGAPAATTGAST